MKNTDKTVAIISSLVLIGSIAALMGYDKVLEKKEPQEVIATVESATSDGLIKSSDSHDYKPLKNNDVILNGDNVISGKNSKILLKFANGPRIMIGEESVLALRQIDGMPDLKIEKGSFSGSFEDGDMMDVLTNNEVISLSGSKDTQFSVAHIENGDVEIGSFDGDLSVEYKGEKFVLNKDKASVSKKTGWRQSTSVQKNQKTNETVKPTGIALDETEVLKKTQSVALVAPFPKPDHIFLHNSGGKVLVYPQNQCKGACELEISLEGKEKIKKRFARDMVPLMYLRIEPGTQAKVTWKFSDGGNDVTGKFEILVNNSQNFQKAIDKKLPVEVLN